MNTVNYSNLIRNCLRSEPMQPLVQGSLPIGIHERQGSATSPRPTALPHRYGGFFRECWRRMKAMNDDFRESNSGDGALSRKRNEERLEDEQAWSRLDDDGAFSSR